MQKKNMLASISVFFIAFAAMAQGDGTPPPPIPLPPAVPIDSGIIVLFIIALGYGAYISYKYAKKTI